MNKTVGKVWEKTSDKVNRLGFELIAIKNQAINGWHPWTDKASLFWCYPCLFFIIKKDEDYIKRIFYHFQNY